MVDWLTVWGVYTVAGFVFKDVLTPLAKGALEDYVKDFFKDSIKEFTGLLDKNTLQTAVGKALKEFLQLMQQELEEDFITGIHRFTNDYPNARVIVTSRTIGYKPQRLRDAQFRHFMLQDLEIEQIRDFVYRWHELTFKDQVDKVRKRERLQTAINTSSSIRELAGNPLVLTMMAILNRNQELPRDRPELYNQASRVLLHQWDVERVLIEDQRLDPKTIDYKDKQAMLRQVAYYMQANEKGLSGNLIGADDLEKILTDYLKSIEVNQARAVARLMINQLRTRNFILCFQGADYYAFVHRTFLEYFCAWEFVWQFEKERKISLLELKTEVFGKHWQDESWHEVLRLIAGMIEPKFAGEVIDYLIEQNNSEEEEYTNLLLASDCLSEVRNRTAIAPTAARLLEHLKDVVKETLEYRTAVKVVTAIATNWKDDPETLPWLKQLATSDLDKYVRAEAVQELAKGWKDEPDIFEFLRDRAINDPFERNSEFEQIPRQIALEAIIEHYPVHPQILPLLRDRANNNPDEQVRKFAQDIITQLSY